MKLYFVDLFCGAGGVTTGIHEAEIEGKNIAEVIACVNHDPVAILSHSGNHKNVLHFVEDVRTLDLTDIIKIVQDIRLKDPKSVICLWASLECTNFSKAKGGMPRNADSRTLAEHLYRYIELLDPESIWIENVEEFMSWGPLDENGKPVNRKAGSDYLKWVNSVKDYGYQFDWKILNAADFGAYTSRKRFFAQFQKTGLPIAWPEPTHSKKPFSDAFGSVNKWKPVKEVLDFSDEGKSIFERPKALSNKTLERIYAGLLKYVAGGKDNFIKKYYSGRPKGKVISTDGPAGSITCVDGQALVKCNFLAKTYAVASNSDGTYQTEQPAHTITTRDSHNLVSVDFLAKYYGGGGQLSSVDDPSSTLTTKDRQALIRPQFWIDRQFTTPAYHQSIDDPAGSILTNPKMNLVAVKWIMNTNFNNIGSSIEDPAPVITANRKHHYLLNPSWGGNNGDVDQPCCTVVARQDKAPLYLVAVENGQVAIAVYENEPEIMIKIKEFMVLYGIVDIKMRMLKILELLKIQGFPDNYYLAGTQADQKKFIGNSVVPLMATALIKASYNSFKQAA